MKITIERELNMEELFDDIVDDFANAYATCEVASLNNDDFTPDVLADIFYELAKIAAKRAEKARRV